MQKLTHSIIGSTITWLLAGLSWFTTHISEIAGIFAILASIYTIRAAIETARMARAKRKQIENRENLNEID